MTKKVNAGFAAFIPEVSKLDFPELERVMQVELREHHRVKLLGTLNSYLGDAFYFEHAPTVAEVRKRAEKIEKHARNLAELLADGSELGQATDAECWPWERYLNNPYFSNSNATIRLLRDLEFKAWVFLDNLSSDNPGRPQNAYLAPFIAAVGRVYDDAGGKGGGISTNRIDGKTPEGALFDGICWLLDKAERTYRRNTVAQVVKDWRKQGDHKKYKKPENWP